MNFEEIVAACDANYYESWRTLAVADGFIHEEDGILIAAPSRSLAWLNVVFVTRPLADPEPQLARAFARMDERGLPFFVHVRDGIDPAAAEACERLGRVAHEPVPGMALAPITTQMIESPLDIRAVQDEESLAALASVIAASFDIPLAETRAMLPPTGLERAGVRYWVGLLDGKPAACSGLIVIGGIAGINVIGTLAEYRGRGFGAAMTWQAVNAGADAGCSLAVLQASAMGKPVYERMGFREVTSYLTFIERDD